MADIDDIGRLAGDDGAAEQAFALRRQLDRHAVAHDVDDFVHGEAHRAAVVAEHQHGLLAGLRPGMRVVERHQRHEVLTVLHDMAAADMLDGSGIDVFETGDELERHGL